MFSSAKHPVLTGTAILTCAGTLSRLIGFFIGYSYPAPLVHRVWESTR